MLRWMDGCEQYGTKARMLEGVGGAAAWSQVDGNWALSTTNPATQTYHMRLTEDGGGATILMRRAIGQSQQVTGAGYRFQVDDLPSIEDPDPLDESLMLLGFRDVSNTRQIRVQLGTEGSVAAYRESTLLGRSDPCVAAGGYHHFEAKSKIANSGGYVEVRVNEVTVLNLTGIDTQNSANAETSQIAFGQTGDVLDSGPGFTLFDVDDIFAWDDVASDPENTVIDFVGDKGCYYLPTNADTGENDFTITGAATAHDALSEVPPSTVDYLSDVTGLARAVVKVAALPSNVSEVVAMMPVLYAEKTESGTVNLNAGVVVGSAESYTPSDSPSTAYAYMTPGPKTVDPSTGVAWANDADPDLLIMRTA